MVQIDNVPSELKTKKCWVGFELVWDDGRQKYSKVPKIATNGSNASSTDPSTWSSFEEAKNGPWDVVGCVVSKEDKLCVIDVDGIVDYKLARKIGSYAEISPSGEGTRILVKGSLPEGAKNKVGDYEIYDHSRCFTLTGNVIVDAPIKENQAAINDYVEKYVGYRTSSAEAENVDFDRKKLSEDDIEELKIRVQVNPTFAKLVVANTEEFADENGEIDRSEVDYALVKEMFSLFGNDPGKVEAACFWTKLKRDKWNEARGDSTYLRYTIANAQKEMLDNGEMPDVEEKEEEKKLSMKERIEEFIEEIDGVFTNGDVDAELGIKTKEEKTNRRKALSRLVKDGKIKRYGQKSGTYRKVKQELNYMNIFDAKVQNVFLPLPLGLSEMVAPMPKNIIVCAGASNAGKTTFSMDLAHKILNYKAKEIKSTRTFEMFAISRTEGKPLSVLINEQINGKSEPINVLYFTSEMGTQEFNFKANLFEGGINSWRHKNLKVIDQMDCFSDAIDPNGINIIDYLEMHDKFWLVGEDIRAIHDKLGNGIAFINIQKADHKTVGKGGSTTKEKARLYITLDNNEDYGFTCKIEKCKIPLNPAHNPNNKTIDFQIKNGSIIEPISEWRYIKGQKHREKINKEYEEEQQDNRTVAKMYKESLADLM
jgi:hypothetical protein